LGHYGTSSPCRFEANTKSLAFVGFGSLLVFLYRVWKGISLKVTRLDIGILCVVGTFLVAAETTVGYFVQFKRTWEDLVAASKSHNSLRKLHSRVTSDNSAQGAVLRRDQGILIFA